MNVIPRKLTRDGRPANPAAALESSLAQTELLVQMNWRSKHMENSMMLPRTHCRVMFGSSEASV
jgi:hypothetical protein